MSMEHRNDIFPFQIKNFGIALNDFCNCECSYCRLKNTPHSYKQIDIKVLDQFYESLLNNPPESFYNIDFHATEPLISFDLIQYIFERYGARLKEYNICHQITTNGKLLTKEIVSFCEQHGILIKISLDGVAENCLKEKGVSLENLKEICKAARDRNRIAFNYVITQERLDNLREDLQSVFNTTLECGGEFGLLLNVLECWPEAEYNKIIDITAKFFIENYYPSLSFFLRRKGTRVHPGFFMDINVYGAINMAPPNRTCRPPEDAYYKSHFSSQFGNIYSQNKELIQEFCEYYKSVFDGCFEEQNIFNFSVEDWQAINFEKLVWEKVEPKIIDYSKIPKRIYGACINLTDDCNMSCRYCFSHAHKREMDLPTAIAAVTWIKANQGRVDNTHINFFGGEPMLKFDEIIKPTVEWAERLGISGITFGLTTNGTLLTPDRVEWLFNHDVAILLSLDGGPETQNYNRPLKNHEDSFLSVVDNIPAILAYYPDITCRSTIYPATVVNLFEDYLWAKHLGFKSYFAMPDEYSHWTQEEIDIFISQYQLIYDDYYNDLSAKDATPVLIQDFQDAIKNLLLFQGEEDSSLERCGLGTISLGIGVDGSIFGCQEHNSYSEEDIFYLGNIYKEGIEPERHLRLLMAYNNGKICSESCPSHTYGVFNNFDNETEIFCNWKINRDISAIELIKRAEQDKNFKFLSFLSETNDKVGCL